MQVGSQPDLLAFVIFFHGRDKSAGRAAFDQYGKPLQTCLFFFYADHIPVGHLAVRGCLGIVELPGSLIFLENTGVWFRQVRAAILICEFAKDLFPPVFIGGQPGWLHASKSNQFFDPLNVGRTPLAAGFAVREPVCVAVVIHLYSNAVDPSKTQGCIQ